MSDRLFNVSNRVVVPKPGENVAGGLDNTLTVCKGYQTIVRLGYSGTSVPNDQYDFEHPEQHITTSSRYLEDGRVVVSHLLDLPDEHYKAFYGRIANENMWHAFHARDDLVVEDRDAIRLYLETCDIYAKATKAVIQDDDDKAVHDYHFLHYAVSARKISMDRPMSLVVHIPIPENAILTSPKMSGDTGKFISGLLRSDIFAYDVVSVQAPRDLVNLEGINGVKNPFSLEPYETKRIRNTDGDSVIVGVFPATGDTEANRNKLEQSLNKKSIKDFWYIASDGRIIDGKKNEGQKLMVAADRIDPSKALDKRLRAVQQGITEGLIDPREVCYMQAAAQSRETLNGYPEAIKDYAREYTRLRDKFDFHVFSPTQNGKFMPLDQGSIFVGYRMADAGLFVSDFDGMHLGPKEFTDVSDPTNPGACVLTKTIGAAHEFKNCAVIVEPTEKGIKEGIVEALSMPLEQRIAQHTERSRIMEENSNQRWINSIVEATRNKNPTYQ